VTEKTSTGFAGRFTGLYLMLGGVLVAGVAIGAVLYDQSSPKPQAWSGWRPARGSTQKVTSEIASHVGGSYLLNKSGTQLVAIVAGAPELTQYTNVAKVSTICTLQNANAQSCSRIISTSGDIQEQLCGLGQACAIERGSASAARERLLRREALEVALYTFKYEPSVNAVIAYMPPPPGQVPSTLLFLERANLQKELSMPLSKTLPLTTPPLPSQADKQEQKTIDNLTVPVEYAFKYQKLSDGTQALILAPPT
jgi:hypothetical protein